MHYVNCPVLKINPSGSAAKGVGLRPIACWDSVFESRREYGCLSLVKAVFCQVEVSVTDRSLVQRSSTERVCLECDREAAIIRRPWPTGAVEPGWGGVCVVMNAV